VALILGSVNECRVMERVTDRNSWVVLALKGVKRLFCVCFSACILFS